VKSDFGDPHLNVTNTYGENGAGPDALTHHGTETLSYDAAGRVTKDGERSYEWDAKGRLAKVTRGTVVEQYIYGHDDTRAVKLTTVDGKTEVTRYIEKDVEERNGALVRYAFLGEQRLAPLDPVDVGARTAPVTKTGSSNAIGANDDTAGALDSRGGTAARAAQALFAQRGLVALSVLVFAAIVFFAESTPLCRCPGAHCAWPRSLPHSLWSQSADWRLRHAHRGVARMRRPSENSLGTECPETASIVEIAREYCSSCSARRLGSAL